MSTQPIDASKPQIQKAVKEFISGCVKGGEITDKVLVRILIEGNFDKIIWKSGVTINGENNDK